MYCIAITLWKNVCNSFKWHTEAPNYYNVHVHKEVMYGSLFTAHNNKKGSCNWVVVDFVSHNSDVLTP